MTQSSTELTGPLTQRFNLGDFTDSLIDDLNQLRAAKISIRDAQARAQLARQVLRSVHYFVIAQKFLEQTTPLLPAQNADGSPVEPSASAKRGKGGKRARTIDVEAG